MLTRPVTVREFVPLIVIRLVAFTAANVREAQLAATSTVQFAPLAIVTAVPLVGTPLLQRAVLLQTPVPLKVDCPSAVMLMKIDNTSKHPARFDIF
jgi:pseudouridine-5'-phosphate glycosidase